MALDFQWTQTAPRRIDIRAESRGILVVFGLPFLAIGLYLLVQVGGALWDVVTLRVGPMDNLLGLTLLPLLAAAFLWPGLLLALARKSIAVDAEAGEVWETTSLRFVEWHRRHAVGDFLRVRAYQGRASTREIDDRDGRDRVPQPYCVDVVRSDSKRAALTVGVAKDPAGARELGNALAAILSVPFADETARDGEDDEDEGLRHRRVV